MNLPFILDVAIGLIFIYLILSLVASEIQEFVATVFQWRAKHLKESIEILLAGGSSGDRNKTKEIECIVDELYDNPLIKNINQEAKGWFGKIPRWVTWKIGVLYRWIGYKITGRPIKSVFGNKKRSGPSYIPSETFATTLLETLNIPILVQKFSESKLQKFKNNLLKDIKDILCNLDIGNVNENTLKNKNSIPNPGEPARSILKNFDELRTKLDEIVRDFKNRKTTLDSSIDRLEKRLERYISIAERQIPEINDCRNKFQDNMESLKRDIFSEKERDVLIARMKPTLTEVVQSINKNTTIFKAILESIKDEDSVTYAQLHKAINSLPESVTESISVLVNRAQARVEIAETDINQLRQEIELWFDRSMERASGVYKRNAKGVAILIGFVIALTANADTFQIANSLSKDSVMRATVTKYAEQAISKYPTSQDQGKPTSDQESLNSILNEVKVALTDISLPIGWKFQQPQGDIKSPSFTLTNALAVLKQILGWVLTGFAVSMGANFWFDLLGKFINVRNTGPKPASSIQERSSSSSHSPDETSRK